MANGTLDQQYAGYMDASSLASALGRGRKAESLADRASKLAGKGGLDTSTTPAGADYSNYTDLLTRSGDAQQQLIQDARNRITKAARTNKGIDIARSMNRFRVNLNKDLEMQARAGAQQQIEPTLLSAEDRVRSMLDTNAISASDEQAMRSNIAAQIRSAESTKMQRLGAMMGIGNMASSPAAAALAADNANEADRTLVSTLRDMGLQVSELNRQDAARTADLATRIAGARAALAIGDSKSLIGMQGDIASMIDALYARDATMAMEKKAMEQAGQGSTMDSVAGWAGIGSSLGSLGLNIYGAFSGAGDAAAKAAG